MTTFVRRAVLESRPLPGDCSQPDATDSGGRRARSRLREAWGRTAAGTFGRSGDDRYAAGRGLSGTRRCFERACQDGRAEGPSSGTALLWWTQRGGKRARAEPFGRYGAARLAPE